MAETLVLTKHDLVTSSARHTAPVGHRGVWRAEEAEGGLGETLNSKITGFQVAGAPGPPCSLQSPVLLPVSCAGHMGGKGPTGLWVGLTVAACTAWPVGKAGAPALSSVAWGHTGPASSFPSDSPSERWQCQ